MKRSKLILNSLILLVGIFFISQAFSYAILLRDEQASKEDYQAIKTLATKTISDKSPFDFKALKEVNPDILGWIQSDNGSIDYPLVKGRDNETYLDHGVKGEKNSLGGIFMDYRNQDIGDPFVLIYGHRTKNRTMFGPLASFTDQPKTRYFRYDSPSGSLRLRPVLAAIIPGESKIDPRDYKDFSKRREFFQAMRAQAVFDLGYELQEKDRLVNLVTCSYKGKNRRLLIVTIQEH